MVSQNLFLDQKLSFHIFIGLSPYHPRSSYHELPLKFLKKGQSEEGEIGVKMKTHGHRVIL